MLEKLPVGTCRGRSPAPHCPQAGPGAGAELCGGPRRQAGGCARRPGCGQCPTQNTPVKEAKSSSPPLLPEKKAGKGHVSLKRS